MLFLDFGSLGYWGFGYYILRRAPKVMFHHCTAEAFNWIRDSTKPSLEVIEVSMDSLHTLFSHKPKPYTFPLL